MSYSQEERSLSVSLVRTPIRAPLLRGLHLWSLLCPPVDWQNWIDQNGNSPNRSLPVFPCFFKFGQFDFGQFLEVELSDEIKKKKKLINGKENSLGGTIKMVRVCVKAMLHMKVC